MSSIRRTSTQPSRLWVAVLATILAAGVSAGTWSAHAGLAPGNAVRGNIDAEGDVIYEGEVSQEDKDRFGGAADALLVSAIIYRNFKQRDLGLSILTDGKIKSTDVDRTLKAVFALGASDDRHEMTVVAHHNGEDTVFAFTVDDEPAECEGITYGEEHRGSKKDISLVLKVPGTCVPRETKRIKVRRLDVDWRIGFFDGDKQTGTSIDSGAMTQKFAR